MMKRSALAILILALVVTLLACGKEGTSTVTTTSSLPSVSAEEIASKASQAAAAVETVLSDTTMNAQIEGQSGGQVLAMTISSQANEALDMVNRKTYAKVQITMDMAVPGQGEAPTSMEMEIYMVEGTAYTKMEVMGQTQWVKEEISQAVWEQQSEFWSLGALLNDPLGLEVLGEEQVDGIDCYVLNITVDAASAWQTMMQQPGVGDLFEGQALDFGEMVRSMAVIEWIAKDTFLPIKIHMEMGLLMDSASMDIPGAEDFSMTMDIETDGYFYGYNQPVTIELPPEAESAVEMPESGG